MAILSPSDRMALPRFGRHGRISGMAWRLVRVLLLWSHRRRTRKRLISLDPHMLHDIGIAPDDALVEARKPFWRP